MPDKNGIARNGTKNIIIGILISLCGFLGGFGVSQLSIVGDVRETLITNKTQGIEITELRLEIKELKLKVEELTQTNTELMIVLRQFKEQK